VDDQLSRQRWIVHLWLIITFFLSLFTFVLNVSIFVHILFGLLFAALVVAHLGHRRRTVTILLGDMRGFKRWITPRGRMAWADVGLLFVTLNVVVSGFFDYFDHRPVMLRTGLTSPIRWHVLSSLVLLVLLSVHTIRRWRRLRTSHVR
jgi:hypothetical protein